jgi:hypothetical protein
VNLITNAITWLSLHAPQLGWVLTTIGLVTLVYKLVRFTVRFEERLDKGLQNLDKLTNNELSHVQISLESLADSFKDMRNDIRELLIHYKK